MNNETKLEIIIKKRGDGVIDLYKNGEFCFSCGSVEMLSQLITFLMIND